MYYYENFNLSGSSFFDKIGILHFFNSGFKPPGYSMISLWFEQLMVVPHLTNEGLIIVYVFRGSESIYDVVWLVINELPETLRQVVDVVSSLSVIAAVLFLIR